MEKINSFFQTAVTNNILDLEKVRKRVEESGAEMQATIGLIMSRAKTQNFIDIHNTSDNVNLQ